MIAGELDRSVREIERKISVSFAILSVVVSGTNTLTHFAGYADTRGILASPPVKSCNFEFIR